MARRSYDLNRIIPPGKRVKVYTGPLNDPSEDPIVMMMDDELSIPMSAQYSSLSNSTSFVRSVGSSLLGTAADKIGLGDNMFTDFVQGMIGGLNTRLGFQAYTSPEPLNISITCSLMAITDAWHDVVDPIRRLQLFIAPKEGDGGFLTDYPGVDPVIAITGGNLENSEGLSFKDASIRIGQFGFNHVVFKNIDTTFSTEVDRLGYPLSAKINMNFMTTFFLTQGMINEELYGIGDLGIPVASRSNWVNEED